MGINNSAFEFSADKFYFTIVNFFFFFLFFLHAQYKFFGGPANLFVKFAY